MAAQEIRRQETRQETRQTDTMRSKKSESFMDKLSGTLSRKKKDGKEAGDAPGKPQDPQEQEGKEVNQLDHDGREALDYALIPAVSKKIEIAEGTERRFLTRESSDDPRVHEVVRLLLGWINDEVAEERIVVKNIQDDLYDGQVLQKLIEKLAGIRIEVPEVSQSEEGQRQKLDIVVSTANRILTPGQYENAQWTPEMIHQKDIVAIIQLLVSLAVHFRAPVRFPEHVNAQILLARKENGQVKTRYATEILTEKQEELCPKGERDAFDTLFDYGPDKLAHVKGSLLAFCNKHLNKINLEVSNIETQFQDGVFLVLMMGLLEGYFVPLHHFHLQVSTHEEKMKNVQFAYQLMEQVGIKPRSRVADIANGDNASKKDKAFNEHEAAIRVFQRAGIYEAYAQTAITVGEVNQIDQERTELHRDETEMVLLPGAEHFDIELWEQTGTLDGPARTSFQETSSQTDPQPSSSC
ncbi:unnamed protein product, partial [Mesorhabditis belari]|uniref:Calponin-homology (CH) domain-containing protein n=1 Tax=Mesorhabditis belari TaxID=2138241 RepID=A0AAF3EQ60_9BILA